MILQPGETILWQGRPEARAPLDVSRPGEMLFGLGFIAFSMLWMDRAMDSGPIWLVGFVPLGLGLRLAVWRAWGPRLRAKLAHYTLTNRRAIVDLRWPLIGPRLRDLHIGPATIIDIDGDDPATIRLSNTGLVGQTGARPLTLCFERIAAPRSVLALMRDVQKGAA